ncbi:MAG: hypothetical protein JWL79_2704, partial [Frankiales bacterium]|nr:hypothetical protein [Frankiales bacterium]
MAEVPARIMRAVLLDVCVVVVVWPGGPPASTATVSPTFSAEAVEAVPLSITRVLLEMAYVETVPALDRTLIEVALTAVTVPVAGAGRPAPPGGAP